MVEVVQYAEFRCSVAGQDLEQVMRRRTLGEISFPAGNIESNVEEKHNYVHTFVGGLMGQVGACLDPGLSVRLSACLPVCLSALLV